MEKRYDKPLSPRPGYSKREKSDRIEMIFGLRPITEALLAGKALERIFLQKGVRNSLSTEISELAHQASVPVQSVPVEKLDNLTRKNHQGAVAFLSAITYAPLDTVVTSTFESGKTPLLLILDRITDVRNFGAIARNAECLGVHALVIPSRGAAQVNGDAIKTSAGALNLVPVCREPNLKDTIRYLQDSGIQIVACTEKAEQGVQEGKVDLTVPTALLMGSEEDGISPEYLKRADAQVKIPLVGQIGSLNVSVATGIVLYEAMRQRLGAIPKPA